MEDATRTHFYHHGDEKYRGDRANCHWCQLRSFPAHTTVPVTVVNETDDSAVLPANFRFINANVLGPGVEKAEASFRSGCSCAADSDCRFEGCLCLADQADDAGDDEDEREGQDEHGQGLMELDSPPQRKKKYLYHGSRKSASLLRAQYLDSKAPLYECHQECTCSSSCPNRVVERGRTIPLQIFRTSNDRGWGVRSSRNIIKGQFVDCYLGEVITPAEADRRRATSSISKKKDVYLFALDKFSDENSYDLRLRGPPLEVDGEFMSGPTRFVNHSCDPNMRIFARVGDHADKHLHDLAFFAIRDVPAGEELTFDYVDGVSYGGEEFDGDRKDMTKCRCGSSQCRGYLW